MSRARWFLGLDGGATKTHCILYDAKEDVLDAVCGGPTNHEVLENGIESLPNAILAIISPLLERAGISAGDVSGASFGMAGVDTPLQHELISGIIRRIGFDNFVLSNDAYLGIKAEGSGFGVSAVNGSGYSVAGIAPDGRMLQIGGHNEMTGDKGGGGILVPAAVRAAYTQLYKRGPQTRITELLFQWLGISARADFCQAVALRIMADSAAAYHDISRILYTAAGSGDGPAREILAECGRDYALSISCVAEELGLSSPVEVILVGSQFTKCECSYAVDVLCAQLEAEGRYSTRVITTAPVAGTLFWAMELAGCLPPEEKRRELRIRLRHPEGGCR